MSTTDWIALVASLAAFITALGGLWYQKHRMDLERKEWEEKLSTSERHLRNWTGHLPRPPAPRIEDDGIDIGLPYQAGAPIRRPELFYGRGELISNARNCVTGANMASMYILGARKSGKTSFFYFLNRILSPDKHPDVVPVILDAQNPISGDKNFYAYMLRETYSALAARSKTSSRSYEVLPEVEFNTLASFLSDASAKGWRFVFMLDEFENLVDNRQISGEEFFASLRSLILKANLSWIPASFRAVYMPDAKTSPFLNIIQETCHMTPLLERDARLLVSEPASRAGHPFDYEDIDLVLDLAGRMPFLLQKACLVLYKAHRAGESRQAARNHLNTTFKLEAQSHFESQISMLLPDEKESLFLLVAQKDVTSRLQNLGLLSKYGFLETTGDEYKIMGRAFEDFIYQKSKEAARLTQRQP